MSVEPEPAVFHDEVSMENDEAGCFAGDRGVLEPDVRRVLVRLLQRRFLLKDRSEGDWAVLLSNQQVIESRLHDLFVHLVIDTDRGIAYKQQVRADELEVPILLRDDAYSRAETLVLIYLRTVYQRESTAGEPSARVDIEEIEQTVLSYFSDADGDLARRQKAIRGAMSRLRQEGIVDEESEGRYLISPMIEIVLSAARLRELTDWLRTQATSDTAGASDAEPQGFDPDRADESAQKQTATDDRGTEGADAK